MIIIIKGVKFLKGFLCRRQPVPGKLCLVNFS